MRQARHTRVYQRLIDALTSSRIEQGITQAQVGKCLRRPQSFVSKYERGMHRLDVVELLWVADCLQIDTSALVAGMFRVLPLSSERLS